MAPDGKYQRCSPARYSPPSLGYICQHRSMISCRRGNVRRRRRNLYFGCSMRCRASAMRQSVFPGPLAPPNKTSYSPLEQNSSCGPGQGFQGLSSISCSLFSDLDHFCGILSALWQVDCRTRFFPNRHIAFFD